MGWTSFCLIALVAGQVGAPRTEPAAAVRPAAADAQTRASENPAAPDDPNSTLPPGVDAARTRRPHEAVRGGDAATARAAGEPDAGRRVEPDVGKRADSGDIPDAAKAIPPAAQQAEPLPANVPALPPKVPERVKNQAQEMVADALQIPPGGTILGQAWPLSQALAAAPDRKQQLLIIHSYWQLTEAVAKYHFAFEQAKQFEKLRCRPMDDAALRAMRAAAAATLRESELAVFSAQHDLAALVQLPAESPLPLPGDRPLVGAYRTNFQELFAKRSPPPIARVVDRTLPIRLTAINDRATAVCAAADACLAAAESYQTGQTDFAAVASAADQLLHERRALLETVCRYNHDIAEYAAAVLAPNISAQQLIGALIESGHAAAEPRPTEKPGEVRPAEYLEPMTPSGELAPVQPAPGQPAPGLRPIRNPPALAPIEMHPTPAKYPPTAALPRDDNGTDRTSFNHSANKPITGQNDSAARPNNSSALYPALIDAAPAARAKQLTLALHWDRSLPENSAKPMSLAECLGREAGENRRETLAVYWTARQRAAEYQAIAQDAEFLDTLSADVLDRYNDPCGAADMLYLRAARLSAKAAIEESQAALVESQFELALKTQTTADTTWPLPSTPPHSGSYDLNLAAQPRTLLASRPMLRLVATIPALATSVQEHAAAVVEADAARSAAVGAYLNGAKPLAAVLEAIRLQSRQTFSFLQTLTDYNRSIAAYSLTVLPPDISAGKLAAALVVPQSQGSEIR